MPAAVLAEIGCRALGAVNGRRTIIVGEGAGQEAWPVIVQIADFVGQRIKVNVMVIVVTVMVVMVASGLGQARGYRQGR